MFRVCTTTIYKYEIRNRHSGELLLKCDPYGSESELRPATASIARPPSAYAWQDDEWITARADWQWLHKPVSIYEVHLGSWRQGLARIHSAIVLPPKRSCRMRPISALPISN